MKTCVYVVFLLSIVSYQALESIGWPIYNLQLGHTKIGILDSNQHLYLPFIEMGEDCFTNKSNSLNTVNNMPPYVDLIWRSILALIFRNITR